MIRAAAPLLLLAASCGSGDEAAQQITDMGAPEPPRVWKDLPEGSKGWFEESTDPKNISQKQVRCWPRKGKWDCLRVSRWLPTIDEPYTFSMRFILNDLKEPDAQTGSAGYSCEDIHDKFMCEGIAGNEQQTIRANEVPPNAAWTREEVETFIRENKVQPIGLYHDCTLVHDLARQGSLLSLQTTDLTYASMTGQAQ